MSHKAAFDRENAINGFEEMQILSWCS